MESVSSLLALGMQFIFLSNLLQYITHVMSLIDIGWLRKMYIRDYKWAQIYWDFCKKRDGKNIVYGLTNVQKNFTLYIDFRRWRFFLSIFMG